MDRRGTLGPGETAWIVTLPCAIVTVVAIAVLGPAVGHALFEPGAERLWPPEAQFNIGHPEPVKHARYALALLGPVLLAGGLLAVRRRPLRVPRVAGRAAGAVAQLLALGLLAGAVVAQARGKPTDEEPVWVIFGDPTIAIAIGLTLLVLVVLRDGRLVSRIARLARDTPRRRIVWIAVAVAFTTLWLCSAIDSDKTIVYAPGGGLILWSMDDAFAVLGGHVPLADYHAIYAQLWPYASAAVMAVLGTTVTVYTLFLTGMSALTLAAVLAVFRRIARSWLLALGLYLPFLAAGFLFVVGPPGSGYRVSNAQIFSMWPMRYGGAYLVAWLVARHVDGAAPRRLWPLFLAGGLVTVDDLEFGLAAVAATIVALLCAVAPSSRRALGRQAAEAAAGLAGGVALVVALTLAAGGALPHLGYLLEFPRLFGVIGLVSERMPLWGFHLVLYATFVGAIGVAVVRARRDGRDPLLTAMLAWSGTFGLLAASYFAGRSDTLKLVSLFSAWAYALALLVVVVVRDLVARPRTWPGLPAIMVLFAFGLAAVSLGETPRPGTLLAHWRDAAAVPLYKEPQAASFVAAHTTHGEKVAILIPMGHRIAYDVGVDNVSPYTYLEAIITRKQLRVLLDAIRSAHARKIFAPDAILPRQHRLAFEAEGFARRALSPAGYSEWVRSAG